MSNRPFPKILLASSSPRRKELLTHAGISFKVLSPKTDEAPLNRESPKQMVGRLALEKAIAVSKQVEHPHCIIIAADTTVVSPQGKNLGKPVDERDAKRILKQILGKTHSVLTAFCILELKNGKLFRKHARTVQTKVKMRKLNQAGISHYVSLGESLDKAGAYAAQGYGMNLIEMISGSYTNVVGLPMAELIQDLKAKFNYPCPY